MELNLPFEGIIPPLITPLTEEQSLDTEALARLLDHVIGGGVNGIFALGTTGEGPYLKRELRHQVVEHVCDRVAGSVPVFVGITDTVFADSVDLAAQAHAAGATAVVLAAPYYLYMEQAELRDYVERLLRELPLPLLLYNMPSCTKVGFDPETVRELSAHPGVVGLKDSSGDLEYFARVARLVSSDPSFTLLVGPEELLRDAIALGAHGGVNGGANLFPQLYTSLHRAASEGNRSLADARHEMVNLVATSVYSLTGTPSGVVRGLKAALAEFGICSEYTAEPFAPLPAQMRAPLRNNLRALVPQLERDGLLSPACAAPLG